MTTAMEHELLSKLKEMGKITDDDVLRADASILTKERKAIVETFHTLLCTLDHDKWECRWYLEHGKPGFWDSETHKAWTNFVIEIMIKLKLGWEEMNAISTAAVCLAQLEDRNPFRTMVKVGEAVCEQPIPTIDYSEPIVDPSEGQAD